MIEFETWLLESDPEKGEERVVNVQEVLTGGRSIRQRASWRWRGRFL